MKILHTADWHIGKRRGPVVDGVNLREKDTELCVEKVIEVAETEQPDIVMISGDLIDVAGTHSERGHHEERVIFSAISKLARCSKYVIVLRGTPNHDGREFFMALSDYCDQFENVITVMEPRVVHTKFMDVACIPGFDVGYYRAKFPGLSKEEENVKFSSELNNICVGLIAMCSKELPTALMAHYTVPGCNTESGQSTFLQQFEPVLSSEALNTAGYDIVCLGHIHRPQQLPNVLNTFYSGAVNALNFSDEGQKRGFYIHEFEDRYHIKSRFINTPYREFITINLDADDIHQINNGALDMVAIMKWSGKVTDKMVRIFYESTDEDKKAFNRSLLEKKLLEDGAFMLWDIAPKNVVVNLNKKKLGKRSDPEENLREYLLERKLPEEKIQETIGKARPIIQQALTNGNNSILTGEFEPIAIEVRNYRNYTEETFDFTDISFCTINGQNGAGKSSLFMDAIIDCLYEEPREGDNTGWIRKDDGVSSGNIIFTFRIGEQIYRVSRARTKSRRLTLSLSEKVNGEWESRTRNKSNDTQKAIEQLLGMDSLTFKSCALIMQDQYGLFLQADKKDRMGILSKLLGLEIYDIMNKSAMEKAKEYGAKKRDIKNEIEIHEKTIQSYGNPEHEIKECALEIEKMEDRLKSEMAERDKYKLSLTHQQETIERRDKLIAAVDVLKAKKETANQNRAMQQAIIDNSSVILAMKADIEAKVAEYNSLLEKEKIISSQSALYSSMKDETENLNKQVETEKAFIDGMRADVLEKNAELEALQESERDEIVRKNASDYELYAGLLKQMQELQIKYKEALSKKERRAYAVDSKRAYINQEKGRLEAKKADLERRTELLKNSGCPDIAHAECLFLSDAQDAKKQLPILENEIADFMYQQESLLQELIKEEEEAGYEVEAVGYDADLMKEYQSKVTELASAQSELKKLEAREGQIALIKADLSNLQSNIQEAEKRLDMVKLKAIEAERKMDSYAKAFEEHTSIQNAILTLKPWLEKEKQLPVAEERKITAANRVLELIEEISSIDEEIAEKQMDILKENQSVGDINELEELVNGYEQTIVSLNSEISKVQKRTGSLQQKIEDVKKLCNEIEELQKKVNEYALETADYDILKDAFSYFGIPHQIVRTILPQLESTANQIIGQMTGGKMGISFRTERPQVSRKKEVLELDVMIEEYGKATLPYLSKSGGEKVKASLAVILALAEIKSSSAGIQLGMLFIDEPPFLDGDGIQAYCDALETIQSRYRNIKIMAITHDPTMKARFPQSLDVVKTENGSKVIY